MIHKKKRENASRLAFQNLEALSLFSCRLFFNFMSTAVQTLKLTEIFVDNKETNKLIDVHVLSQPSP